MSFDHEKLKSPFEWGFSSAVGAQLILVAQLMVSIAAILNVPPDFSSREHTRVNVGVSRSVADRANELIKVSGRESLRSLGKDLGGSNGSGHSTF